MLRFGGMEGLDCSQYMFSLEKKHKPLVYQCSLLAHNLTHHEHLGSELMQKQIDDVLKVKSKSLT